MQKQRRKAFALPAGRRLSLTEDLEPGNALKRQERDSRQDHQKQNSPKNPAFRRASIVSMTLGPYARRRKNSCHLMNASSRAHDFLQQDTENHLAVMLGSPGVGKTALVVRYVTGRFVHEYDPTLEMTYEKLQEVGSARGILRILDTAGPMDSSHSCLSYIRKAEGIIVVYSITDRYSFETAKDHLRTIKEFSRLGSPFDYELPTILVGNKRELRRAREVSREEARRVAKECGCLFIESSAACDRNVQKIFMNVFLQIHRIKEERQKAISSNTKSFVNSVRNFFHSKKK